MKSRVIQLRRFMVTLALMALLTAFVVRQAELGNIWTYHSHLNGGIAALIGGTCYGFEVYGTPGFFKGGDC